MKRKHVTKATVFLPNRLSFASRNRKLLSVIVIAIITVSGIFVINSSRAATPYTAAEAEQGTVTSPASKVSDAGASGGQAVVFGSTPTTPPTPSPPPAVNGFPSDATTGYKSCGKTLAQLTPMGSVTLTDNQVLENFDMTGSVTVAGSNVTIRCGRIRTSGLYAISATRNGGESYLAEGVEMQGVAEPGPNNSAAVAPYGTYVLSKVNVWRFKDGIKLGSNHTVQDSWIHDLWKVDGSHNDGMQSVGGRNVKILRNNIEGPWQASTSALILGAGTGGFLEDYTIDGNRLSGGTYAVYIGGKDGNPTPQNIKVRNNHWVGATTGPSDTTKANSDSRNSWAFGSLSTRLNWPAGDPGAEWSGNIFTVTGQPYNR